MIFFPGDSASKMSRRLCASFKACSLLMWSGKAFHPRLWECYILVSLVSLEDVLSKKLG